MEPSYALKSNGAFFGLFSSFDKAERIKNILADKNINTFIYIHKIFSGTFELVETKKGN